MEELRHRSDIQIKLLNNRRFVYANRRQNIVITAENKATEITVLFPDEYENYSKRVDFVNSQGREWTEGLYTPEYGKYPSGFNKIRFHFTLPSEITTEGELKMQFLAYKPDKSMTTVPFEIIPIDVVCGILAFKKNARSNPDLLILSYNQSTEALFKSSQAKAKSIKADELSQAAMNTANQAESTADDALEIAKEARQAAEESANAADAKAENAVRTAEQALVVATEASDIAGAAKDKAVTAVQVSTSAESKADSAILAANQAKTTAETAESKSLQAVTMSEQARAIAQTAESKSNQAITESDSAVMKSDAARGVADYAKNRADYASERAEESVNIATDAVTEAVQAKGKAEQALQTANVSQSLIGTAIANSETAVVIALGVDAKAQTALDRSAAAQAVAENAAMTADEAKAVAEDAKTLIDEAHEKSEQAMEKAEQADNKADNAQIAADAAQQTADSALELAQTAVQVETDPTVPSWAKQPNKPTYTPLEIGAATAEQGAKAETALQSYTETDPTVPSWAKQPNKPTYTPLEIGAATAVQGAKADTALQSYTETDPTVPAWAKQPNKPAYTPEEIGAATAAQGAKADTALQSYTETDPTVPSWAKAAAKPSYLFSEISGIAAKLQLPADLLSAGNNISVARDASGGWNVSAEIPFLYECNGVDDNVALSNIVKDFLSGDEQSDTANLKITVKGTLCVNSYKQYGSGSYPDYFRAFEFGVTGYTGSRRVTIDFSGAEAPELNPQDTVYTRMAIFHNCNIPVHIKGLNLTARRTGTGGPITCFFGDSFTLTDCNIVLRNECNNGSFGVEGANCVLSGCNFSIYGTNYTCYSVNGEKAVIINCTFNALSGDVYHLNSTGAFVQGCRIRSIGASTTQVQCNNGNDSMFVNCLFEIEGKGTLRCNSATGCYFANCVFKAFSTEINSSVTANQGRYCYFSNCKLTAEGNSGSSLGVSANGANACFFISCELKSVNNRAAGKAYGANVWSGVMIGCDIYAYIPEDGTGEAAGFFLNSAATNNCIISGCRFKETALAGYKQGLSVVIDGTTTGGRYIITNNFLQGAVRLHEGTGDNYIMENNITGGTWA